MKEITVKQLFHTNNALPVDVRSPLEFKDGSIPGAVNIPLFYDEERKEVGTIYKQQGPEAAKWRAMEIVAPKLPDILGRLRKLEKEGYEPVIHCWRGGMRSNAAATFLEFSGLPATRLIGGYRAYREYILDRLPAMLPPQVIVLHGRTGVGKTELLKLLKERGYPVVDLEEIAGHRGSIFGSIGIGEGHNQKTFDALLFKSLSEIKEAPYFIIEAESKRIGRASMPDELLVKKTNGLHINVEAALPIRIKRIYGEYVEPFYNESWFHSAIVEKLGKIEKRLKSDVLKAVLKEAVQQRNYLEIIQLLLEHYYDPRYDFASQEYEGKFFHTRADDLHQAAAEIENYIQLNIQPKNPERIR